MVTREEKLKKINDELELVSDEELDNVAGGTYNETAGDTRFLRDLAEMCDAYGADVAFLHSEEVAEAAAKAWSKFGIGIDTGFLGSNAYYFDGARISRQQAFQIACEKIGKKLEDLPGGYNL